MQKFEIGVVFRKCKSYEISVFLDNAKVMKTYKCNSFKQVVFRNTKVMKFVCFQIMQKFEIGVVYRKYKSYEICVVFLENAKVMKKYKCKSLIQVWFSENAKVMKLVWFSENAKVTKLV